MRHPYRLLACAAILTTAALYWRHNTHPASAAEVAPYTAHLTITQSRTLPDGTTSNTVSTEILARDRQGRTYQKVEHGSVFIQDPAKQQTLSWSPASQAAILGQWPHWAGRQGCWADDHGQIQSRFPTDDDWHKLPASPQNPKLETIGSIFDPSTGKRIKTEFVTENLGHKEIHGLDAYGMRMTTTPLESGAPNSPSEDTTELWKSSEFNLKLLQINSGPAYGLERREVTDLDRGDPDSALFHPPPGYKVETVHYHQVPCEHP